MVAEEHAAAGVATSWPDDYVLGFREIDDTQVAVVGGKGAHLGALSRIEGIGVPPGFCVTTDAFRRIMSDAAFIDEPLDRLSHLNADDGEAIRTLSAEIRRTLEGIAIPDDLAAAITRQHRATRRRIASWIVGGTASDPPRRVRTSSSTNSGFPSLRTRTASSSVGDASLTSARIISSTASGSSGASTIRSPRR
jgi:hypothetical protein